MEKQHTIREATTYPATATLLPVMIEQAARQIFEQFGERLRAGLNGREERALKLALEGHVTHKSGRIFSVLSEDGSRAYLVDLERRFCTCPDSRKGHICKHRMAAYMIEQAQAANSSIMQTTPQPVLEETQPRVSEPRPYDPDEGSLERARYVLQSAKSNMLRQAIVYACVQFEDEPLPVEVVGFEGEVALVRALPEIKDNVLVPCFPFEGRQASAKVLAQSLFNIRIYR